MNIFREECSFGINMFIGTYLFKLGMENNYKNYVNQYSMNTIALNKFQKSEDRDKKRHMSYKFSLTAASEFKWPGNIFSK